MRLVISKIACPSLNNFPIDLHDILRIRLSDPMQELVLNCRISPDDRSCVRQSLVETGCNKSGRRAGTLAII